MISVLGSNAVTTSQLSRGHDRAFARLSPRMTYVAGVGEGSGVLVGRRVTVAEGLGVAEAVGEAVYVDVGEAVCVLVGVEEAVAVAVKDGVEEANTEVPDGSNVAFSDFTGLVNSVARRTARVDGGRVSMSLVFSTRSANSTG